MMKRKGDRTQTGCVSKVMEMRALQKKIARDLRARGDCWASIWSKCRSSGVRGERVSVR